MVSQFVLRPLNVLGQHLGNFYANLLEPLPWVWKLPVLLLATTIIVVVILIAFRYRLNFGFNLFCLEPTSYKSLSQSEEPKKDNERKTEDSIPCKLKRLLAGRWVAQKAKRWNILFSFEKHAVLFTLALLSGFFIKGRVKKVCFNLYAALQTSRYQMYKPITL